MSPFEGIHRGPVHCLKELMRAAPRGQNCSILLKASSPFTQHQASLVRPYVSDDRQWAVYTSFLAGDKYNTIPSEGNLGKKKEE